jgi:8-oxo-dGTP pyrophosphatase MutT (NUDIX family)
MTLLRHIEACNRFDPAAFMPFTIAREPIGHVSAEAGSFLVARRLAMPEGSGVGIAGRDYAALSAALAEIIAALAGAGLAAGPRREMTPVLRRWGEPPLAEIDRSGLPGLGLPAFGIHVNGFVRKDDGLHLWVGRRARDRLVAPGKLDHLVAGGITAGHSAEQTVIKEAEEEASLPADIAGRARPVGAISYRLALPEGLRNDTLFVYDLEMDPGIVPASNDGEVEEFMLWPVARVIETARRTDDFKFNVNSVVIDFLIRHGIVGPDSEPDYTALVKGLRR